MTKLDEIEALLQGGKLDEAHSLLKSISPSLEPPASLAPADRGKFLQNVGDWAYASGTDLPRAERAFRALIEYEKASGEDATGRAFTYSRLANALVKAEQMEAAFATFKEGTDLLRESEPTYQTAIYFSFGQALFDKEKYFPAADALRIALKYGKDEEPATLAGIQLFLAMSLKPLVEVKQLAKQLQALQKQAAEVGVANPELEEMAGQLDQTAGDLDTLRAECEQAYVQAIAGLPEDGEAGARARRELEELRQGS